MSARARLMKVGESVAKSRKSVNEKKRDWREEMRTRPLRILQMEGYSRARWTSGSA